MRDVFISHAEEDSSVALSIAAGLQAVGYTTWSYEEDSDVGFSYLSQIDQEIEETQVVVLVISPHSLGSEQVAKEIVRAHESGKPFLPVRRNVAHERVQQRREWRMALGAAVSIPLPPEGVPGLMPRLLRGLDRLGVTPSNDREGAAARAAVVDEAQARRTPPNPSPAAQRRERLVEPQWREEPDLDRPARAAAAPLMSVGVAGFVGFLGVLFGVLNFARALSPQGRPEAWVYVVSPWLQITNILSNFAGFVLYGAVLFGVWRVLQGDGGGARLVRTSSIALLGLAGGWFLFAIVGLVSADRWSSVPDNMQAAAIANVIGATLIAAAMAGIVYAMFRPRPATAQ